MRIRNKFTPWVIGFIKRIITDLFIYLHVGDGYVLHDSTIAKTFYMIVENVSIES